MLRRRTPCIQQGLPETGNSRIKSGIFILLNPVVSTATGKRQSLRRQRNWCRFFVSVKLFIFVALYLVFSKSPSWYYVNDVKFSSDDEDVSSSATTRRIQTAEPPKIPRRLIFTSKNNLVEIIPSQNGTFVAVGKRDDPITLNVLHTIEQYQDDWGETDARARRLRTKHQLTEEEVVVSFLTDGTCLEVITKAEPRLVQYFRGESRGEFKADICRFAELYLYGGFSFGLGIGVVEPLNFDGFYLPTDIPDPFMHLQAIRRNTIKIPRKDDFVTFSSVYDTEGQFLQAFTAATPRHPVLRKALDIMVASYEGTLDEILPQFIIHAIEAKANVFPIRKKLIEMSVGAFSLSMAYRLTTDKDWEEYVSDLITHNGDFKQEPSSIPAKKRYSRFLYEVALDDKVIKKMGLFADYPLMESNNQREASRCNNICFEGHQVFFYSTVPGSKGCPVE